MLGTRLHPCVQEEGYSEPAHGGCSTLGNQAEVQPGRDWGHVTGLDQGQAS